MSENERATPKCHRSGRGQYEWSPCGGSACALWLAETKASEYSTRGLRTEGEFFATPTGRGCCADNPRAILWRDPAAAEKTPKRPIGADIGKIERVLLSCFTVDDLVHGAKGYPEVFRDTLAHMPGRPSPMAAVITVIDHADLALLREWAKEQRPRRAAEIDEAFAGVGDV